MQPPTRSRKASDAAASAAHAPKPGCAPLKRRRHSPARSTCADAFGVRSSPLGADMVSKLNTLMASPESEVTQQTLDTYLGVYNMLCWIAVGAGVLLVVSAPLLKKWQHGVK